MVASELASVRSWLCRSLRARVMPWYCRFWREMILITLPWRVDLGWQMRKMSAVSTVSQMIWTLRNYWEMCATITMIAVVPRYGVEKVFGFDFVVMAISDCAVFLTMHEIDFEIFKMWLECSTYHVDACGWSWMCWNDVCFWFGLAGMICSSSHLDAFLTIYEDDFENFKLLPEWPTYHVDAYGWSRCEL